MRRYLPLVAAAAIVAAAAGYKLARRPERDGEVAALRQALALSEAKSRRSEAMESHVRRAACVDGEVVAISSELKTAQELVAAVEGMARHEDLFRRDVVDFVSESLTEELRRNPAALEWTLRKFREAAGTDLAALLAIPLGQVRDPAVEAAALDLARSGAGEPARLAGLELLDRLDIENPDTHAAVLELVRGDAPSIQKAAVYALHRGLPSPAQARDTAAALAALASHADAELRRRATVALAEWAPDAASLDPVVRALKDASPDVRAGAAFALGRTRVNLPDVPRLLAARVADPNEDWAVRDLAWQSLTRFPLDESTYAIAAKFREARDAAGEASDAGPIDP